MAFTARTLRLLEELRVEVTALTDAHTRALTAAWVTAWDDVAHALTQAVQDAVENGLTGHALITTSQMTNALQTIADQLDSLAAASQLVITGSLQQVVSAAITTQAAIITSQLPRDSGTIVRPAPREALDAIVQRATEQITAAHWMLSPEAEDAVRRALIRGVAGGINPRRTAQLMVQRAEGGFNGGLTRALTISRTETLDAWRNAAAVHQQANADVLAGWVWVAQLSVRTCPSCWAMHGTQHDLDEPGPNDHQNGRCTRAPKTRSWRDLGFDIDEPPDLLPDARATFERLPRNEQMAVMGPQRLDALDAGLPWGQLAETRTNPGWRDSIVPTPARELAAAVPGR